MRGILTRPEAIDAGHNQRLEHPHITRAHQPAATPKIENDRHPALLSGLLELIRCLDEKSKIAEDLEAACHKKFSP